MGKTVKEDKKAVAGDIIGPTVIDENAAPFVPESETRTAYHCPRTSCNGHFYLKLAELGRESVCEKCGLQLTIGPAAGSFKEVHLDRDYRRGFQRFYAVLSLGWAATILFVILSGFWEPWYMPIFNGGWSSVDAHSVSGRTPVADTPPSGGSQFGGVPVDPLPQTATEQKPLSVVSSEPLPQTETIDDFLERRHREQRARALGLQRTTMWKWAVGVALLPPLIAYLCLFVIIPWVYRGFTPALHS